MNLKILLQKSLIIANLVTLCFPFYSFAQTETELTGDIIFYDRCNEQGKPVTNAFDNDINTYFTSCSPFGNWIGLDLKEKHIITRIAYCPRTDDGTPGSDYRERIQLGVFEGANHPDFGDAIPLFVIPGLTERRLTEQEINCTKGFRYVRFVFPTAVEEGKSSYLAELKFYGHEGNGDNSKLPQITNLPTVSIHTVNVQDITSKTEYVKGIISIVSADGTKIHTDSLEIRGRGNNSWTHPKKPYRIKMYKKARLLGLPADAKSWTLINSYGDKTLMRNLLAFDFSQRIEMPYTSPAEAVDVVLNGDYKGCYQLCDHIEVRKNRVEVEEITPNDISGINLTGGYHLEISAYAQEETKWFTSNNYPMPTEIKYPDSEEIVETQERYIIDHFNKMTEAVYGSHYADPETGFRKYIDTETFLRYFLVGEYTGNTDTYWQTKIYKNRGDDKFYFGPVWDFDLSFDNDSRTYPINTKTPLWLALSAFTNAAGDAKNFVSKIMSDPEMTVQLKAIYSYYRDRNSISKESLLAVVDDYANYLDQSQQLNFKRWRIMDRSVHENPVVHGSYDAEIANVKEYINQRIDWIDSKLEYVRTAIRPVSQENPKIGLSTSKNTIRLTGITASVRVHIVNLAGVTVFKSTVSSDLTVNLPTGIYLTVITEKSGQSYTCKNSI